MGCLFGGVSPLVKFKDTGKTVKAQVVCLLLDYGWRGVHCLTTWKKVCAGVAQCNRVKRPFLLYESLMHKKYHHICRLSA